MNPIGRYGRFNAQHGIARVCIHELEKPTAQGALCGATWPQERLSENLLRLIVKL